MFNPLSDKPDHPALELEILALWEQEQTFEQLRDRNRGNPHWSFVDGPVTANKSLGVHTAWGRTLKDVFQRYKGLRGFDQRYQNGFDCQGLWIEVGVERELGLNSKREIEEYGLEAFARRCRDVVVRSSDDLTRGCKRLGQWMDWGNDYFTFSDTNIEYIWKFLKHANERGWLYAGHRSTEWCPRCGTSISQHELTGSYVDRADPSLYVRFPLKDRPGESIVIWTTTPWTLPANVAAAVNPDEDYGRRLNGEWVAAPRYPDERFTETLRGSELVGWRYEGPFDDLAPGAAVEHRVIPWDDVAMTEGTGVVHIAPGCGGEDFELARVHDLPVLTPVDEAGRFYDEYGWLHGSSTAEAAEQIIGRLEETGRLVEAGLYEHRYPECWRCHTPLIFRIADDWFISVDELRPKLIEANATIEWVPAYFEKRMEDWLRNMGDWNISRRRYYGLPLPIYPCSCGHTTLVGSKAELAERALGGMEQLEELRRPWIDRVPIRCEACDEPVTRIPEVGDVWLDAGIVPFSTLGWQNADWIEGGYATGAAHGLTRADLPDHAYWEKWFPADWVTEMREQIRLWFYSQLFMSVALIGRAPFKRVLGYEKMFDENGREMHGSWGNMIDAEDAFAQMGADVMRWQYCRQPPNQDLWFGFGPAHEVKRKLLTFWNSVKFLVDYGNIEGFAPSWGELEPDLELRPLDRWLVERTKQLVAEATAGYEATLTMDVVRAFDEFVDDVSNWYIRRSRRRFYSFDEAAFRTLWFALVQSLRVVAPVMPFLADHLWRNLVQDGPRSVHLAGWPEPGEPDGALLAEIATVRRVVELGRQARSASQLKLRQPLRRLVVAGAGLAREHADEIADELRVKSVEFGEVEASELRVKPNLPVLGPKLGGALRQVGEQLRNGAFEELDGGRFQVDGHVLEPDEVLVERVGREGWAVASDDGVTVALDTALDDELRLEAKLLDRVHEVNVLRKESGLAITDRIRLWVPDEDVLARHEERLASETLAVEVELGPVRIEKVES
jgi:isoleucyl-tRNA synthetase